MISRYAKEEDTPLNHLVEKGAQQPVTETQRPATETTTQNNLNITPTRDNDKKAAAKGKVSNKFIGYGLEGSSTAEYARQAEDKANTGHYTEDDVVFVSINGKRGNEEARHAMQEKTIEEALKAIEAGATLITDNKEYTENSAYNEGEKRLAGELESVGAKYSERIVDGFKLGVWRGFDERVLAQHLLKQELSHLADAKHIPLHFRNDFIKYFADHGYDNLQAHRELFNSKLKKDEIRAIQDYIETLPKSTDTSRGLYLLYNNHIYTFNTSLQQYWDNRADGRDGFEIVNKFDVKRLDKVLIDELKKKIENGNIRSTRDVDSWIKKRTSERRHDISNNINAEIRSANRSDALVDSRSSEGESGRGFSDKSGSANSERGRISDDLSLFTTPNGEIFAFATPEGDIYVDETKISPEHPMHEYAHVWAQVVNKTDLKLWSRGVELAKETSLWKEIADSDAYGKKWKQMVAEGKMTQRQFDNRVASEVHARLVGQRGSEYMMKIAKQKGGKNIIAKVRAWLLEAFKALRKTFGNWSDEDLKALTFDDMVNMTVRDFFEAKSLVDYKKLLARKATQPAINQGQQRSYGNDITITQNASGRLGSLDAADEKAFNDAKKTLQRQDSTEQERQDAINKLSEIYEKKNKEIQAVFADVTKLTGAKFSVVEAAGSWQGGGEYSFKIHIDAPSQEALDKTIVAASYVAEAAKQDALIVNDGVEDRANVTSKSLLDGEQTPTVHITFNHKLSQAEMAQVQAELNDVSTEDVPVDITITEDEAVFSMPTFKLKDVEGESADAKYKRYKELFNNWSKKITEVYENGQISSRVGRDFETKYERIRFEGADSYGKRETERSYKGFRDNFVSERRRHSAQEGNDQALLGELLGKEDGRRIKENARKIFANGQPEQFGWARKSGIGYEVSSQGDRRFSARYALFKPGTTWKGHDIGSKSVEWVYQNIAKQSGKGQPPAKGSMLYNESLGTDKEREDYSYNEAYLPLWQLWAEQHPEFIESLRERASGKTLTDQFASTRVSQARALADILNGAKNNDNGQQELQSGPMGPAIQTRNLKIDWEPKRSGGSNAGIAGRSEEQQNTDNPIAEGSRGSLADVSEQVSQVSNSLDNVLASLGIEATKQSVRQSTPQEFYDAISAAIALLCLPKTARQVLL